MIVKDMTKQKETFLKQLSKHIVILVTVFILFILQFFVKDCVKPNIVLSYLKNA